MNVTILQDPSVGAVQPQPDPNQYGGYYGYTHGYETYGYAPPAQDPNMYYGYSGYGNYQQPQQSGSGMSVMFLGHAREIFA